MSASDHLGGQFTEVHRGIFLGNTGVNPKAAELAGRIADNPAAALRAASKSTRYSSGLKREGRGMVGVHWSTQQDVADQFGRGHWVDQHIGVTLHGQAGHESVMPDAEATRRDLGTLAESGGEHEVTMRPGSSVRLTGVTVHHNGASRYHALAKPKEVRA